MRNLKFQPRVLCRVVTHQIHSTHQIQDSNGRHVRSWPTKAMSLPNSRQLKLEQLARD